MKLELTVEQINEIKRMTRSELNSQYDVNENLLNSILKAFEPKYTIIWINAHGEIDLDLFCDFAEAQAKFNELNVSHPREKATLVSIKESK